MLKSLAGMKILVTGGGGFLGRHLLPKLAAGGAIVRSMGRSVQAALPSGVEAFRGDCRNRDDVLHAAEGQDLIIHMAGLLFGARWEDYLAANGAMAANVAEAFRGKRVIHISSLAAAGPSAIPKKEDDPPGPVSAYGWSKYLAEQLLQKSCGDLAILRPPIIYGSGDRGLLPLFRSCGRGIGITSGDFPLSLVHADDCASAIVSLCRHEARGIYHLSDGEIHNLKEICHEMAKAQGRDKILVAAAPPMLLKASAHLSALFHHAAVRVCGIFKIAPPRPPAWNVDKLREALAVGWVADNRKICSELGFSPQMSLTRGMEEAVAGYRREGLL